VQKRNGFQPKKVILGEVWSSILKKVIMKGIKKQHILQELAGSKDWLFSKYGIKEMAIFGSVSREENTDKSDLDILVDFNRPIGIEFIDLADELETLLKVKIDLVSKGGLKEKYFRVIEKDLAYV